MLTRSAKDETLLPQSLWFPDPYIIDASNPIWQTPITLTVQAPPTPAPPTVVNGTTAVVQNETVSILPALVVGGVQKNPEVSSPPQLEQNTTEPVVANIAMVADTTTANTTTDPTADTSAVAITVDAFPSASSLSGSASPSTSALVVANLVGIPSASATINQTQNAQPTVVVQPVVAAAQEGCNASVVTTTFTQVGCECGSDPLYRRTLYALDH
jgi:hypothetical protein